MDKKVGIAGVGAIGGAVAKALVNGIKGFQLHMVSDPNVQNTHDVPNVDFETLSNHCDLIIECLPAHFVSELARYAYKANADIIYISSAALLLSPEILENAKKSSTRSYLPSGALCGLDGVRAMREMGINSAKIASTKPPFGFSNAPYIIENKITLSDIKEKTRLFTGNAYDAAKGFPANVNVAATLSLAGIGAEKTVVEIWADPSATGNVHEISVKSDYSALSTKIENQPDPKNPKSSVLAAQSIVATLRNMHNALTIT